MVDFTGGTWRSLIDGSEVVAIPDSAIYYWDPSEFADPWVDEVVDEEMSVSGLSSSAFDDGTDAVEGGGSDDGTAPNIDLRNNEMTIEYEIQTTTSDEQFVMGSVNSSGDTRGFMSGINGTTGGGDSEGDIGLWITDSNGNQLEIGGSVNINNGEKRKVTFKIPDASNNEIDLIVDGEFEDIELLQAESPNAEDMSDDIDQPQVGYWGRFLDGSMIAELDGKLGTIIFHDEAVDQTI